MHQWRHKCSGFYPVQTTAFLHKQDCQNLNIITWKHIETSTFLLYKEVRNFHVMFKVIHLFCIWNLRFCFPVVLARSCILIWENSINSNRITLRVIYQFLQKIKANKKNFTSRLLSNMIVDNWIVYSAQHTTCKFWEKKVAKIPSHSEGGIFHFI